MGPADLPHLRLLIVVPAVVIANAYIPGSDSEPFKCTILLRGVLISLDSTSMISNVIAGYTMTYRRAFRLGDRRFGSQMIVMRRQVERTKQ